MTIAATLFTLLSADSAVTGIVGNRIYPGMLKQGGIMPAITYTILSGSDVMTTDGPAGLENPTIQVDMWAGTYAAVDALWSAVRSRMLGYRSGPVQGIFLANMRDLPDNENGLYRRSADFSIWNEESL